MREVSGGRDSSRSDHFPLFNCSRKTTLHLRTLPSLEPALSFTMLILLSTLILSLLSLTFAQYSNSSVFIFDGDKNTQFVFALQADKYAGDLFFHLSAPSGNEWVAVGIGNQMAGSLMFIAYPDGNGDGITLSPRIADGHSEPTYSSNIQLELQAPNTGTEDQTENIFKVNGVCRSCVTWNDGQGSIDLTSSAQPFIFAVGPPFPPVRSDSKSAGLTEHIFVGHFTMNMPAATVQYGGSVPPGPYTIRYGASSATDTQQTNEPGPRIHGLIMCIVFVLLFPFGSLILRVWNKVKAHAIVQVIATILFCMAFAAGIVVSSKYNRSKHFNSAHQVIGILLLIAILSQLVLGILHHRVYKKEQRKTIRGWIHLYLGPAIIFFGLINGGLGFAFAREYTIPTTIHSFHPTDIFQATPS